MSWSEEERSLAGAVLELDLRMGLLTWQDFHEAFVLSQKGRVYPETYALLVREKKKVD